MTRQRQMSNDVLRSTFSSARPSAHQLSVRPAFSPFIRGYPLVPQGGISKATRQLHLTEDVFCGCNHTLRGGRIRYKEYISCGKVCTAAGTVFGS
jgi:hypothetical protein